MKSLEYDMRVRASMLAMSGQENNPMLPHMPYGHKDLSPKHIFDHPPMYDSEPIVTNCNKRKKPKDVEQELIDYMASQKSDKRSKKS